MLHRIIFCNIATYWHVWEPEPDNMGFAGLYRTRKARLKPAANIARSIIKF